MILDESCKGFKSTYELEDVEPTQDDIKKLESEIGTMVADPDTLNAESILRGYWFTIAP